MALGLSEGRWQYKALKRRSSADAWWDVPGGWRRFRPEQSEKVSKAYENKQVDASLMLQMHPNVNYTFTVHELCEPHGMIMTSTYNGGKAATIWIYCKPVKPALATLDTLEQDGMMAYTFTNALTGTWFLTVFRNGIIFDIA